MWLCVLDHRRGLAGPAVAEAEEEAGSFVARPPRPHFTRRRRLLRLRLDRLAVGAGEP